MQGVRPLAWKQKPWTRSRNCWPSATAGPWPSTRRGSWAGQGGRQAPRLPRRERDRHPDDQGLRQYRWL